MIIPPWMNEITKVMGLHECKDRQDLYTWLKSAGKSVDPKVTPWCGDAVETALLRALPYTEVPEKPFASVSWRKYGMYLPKPIYGAIMVFWRGKPSSWKGHVGFYTGETDTHYMILGGNQSNEVNVMRIAKDRLRKNGIRWPKEYPPSTEQVIVSANDLPESVNEA